MRSLMVRAMQRARDSQMHLQTARETPTDLVMRTRLRKATKKPMVTGYDWHSLKDLVMHLAIVRPTQRHLVKAMLMD